MTISGYKPRTANNFIAVHCSATPPSMDIGEDDIRAWHLERKFSDIGYNLVIKRDGTVQVGRPLDYRGAHVAHHNDEAIGVCLIGGVDENGTAEFNYTDEQMASLLDTICFLRRIWPDAEVKGHRDFPGVTKACPCFDVAQWLENQEISNDSQT